VQKFQLVLLIHAHQPVGNFDDVLERAYAQSYLPFVALLEKHPQIRIGMHFSGCLLEWLERAHPEYFELLGKLAARDQVEMVGGGFYEPILISIPHEDRREQLERLGDYLEDRFGKRPRGAWLTERVWEPQLPSTLAPAGVEYTLVDDNHFLGAGFEPAQLRGSYIAEDLGASVHLIPGLKALRYLIPYKDPAETISFLRHAATEHPGGFVAMGDDCEKFGVWPKTYDHCYRDRWLERFYETLEANADWLEMVTPAEAVRSHPALGRAELGTASYNEMMEWALPTAARGRFEALEKEFSSRPDVQTFLHGGNWRSFMAKYAEANLLQKKMLHVSAKVRRMAHSRRRGSVFFAARKQAQTHLLRAQCNDAYWHGVFGGLYAPHLRTALWRSLVEAEKRADGFAHREASYVDVKRFDFDSDGREDLYFTSDRYAALVSPADGATVAALDFRRANVTLVNSIARRREAYHARLKDTAASAGAAHGAVQGAVSIHEQSRAKEAGLERLLRYDHWNRHAFRLLLFPANQTFSDYEQLRIDDHMGIAAGNYSIARWDDSSALLRCEQAPGWTATKHFTLAPAGGGFEMACDIELCGQADAALQVGVEMVVNFLAPDAPDRYFELHGERHPLRWAAATPASDLRVVDEWQNTAVTIAAPGAREFWIAPIETVSESEDGFERVYQGSQILAVWPVEAKAGATWRGRLAMKVTRAR